MKVLWITVGVVILDQITKLWVKSRFYYGESIDVVGSVLKFTYIENPGMAFGIRFAGPWFFTIFSAIASVIIFVLLYRMRHEALTGRIALSLVLGGAIGNLIDRSLYGRVVDFIDVGIGTTRWPVFNLADSAVTVGMILLIALMIFEKEHKEDETSGLKVKNKELPESEERDIWQTPE